MAKLVLGKRPATFTTTVKVDLLDGTTGTIECTYNYKTKSEFGEFVDRLSATVDKKVQTGSEEEVKFLLGEFFKEANAKTTDYLLEALAGWNLDVEFSRESVEKLCDELPGAAARIIEQYRAACVEGRAKN